MKTVLCLDIGTTSLKAAIVSAEGEVVSFYRSEFENFDEKSISSLWYESFFQGVKSLDKKLSECLVISAISVSGNGPTVVTDSGISVLWNSVNIKDFRLSEDAKKSLFIPKILLLKNKYPNDFHKARYIFSGPEYLIYLLGGKPITILPEKRFMSAYWNELICKECDIPFEKMPPFVEIGNECGIIKSEIADVFEQLNLSKLRFEDHCKIFGAGPDFVAALIGTNTLSEGKLCDRCGSSEGLNLCVPKFIQHKKIRSLPSVISNLWNISYLIPDSSNLNENKRLKELKKGIEILKRICKQNDFIFPKKMSISGGQANDIILNEKKENLLGINIIYNNTIVDSELIGDACVAFYGLGVYKTILEASEKITQKR